MSALRPGICTALTEEVWLSLRQAHIYTVIDFVVRDKEDIARACGIAYKDVVSISRVLLAQFSSFPVSAFQLYSNAVSSQAIFSTGFAGLDELLDGGLYAGELCELAGEAAVGKTQVCLRCAASVAGVHAQSVMCFDSCGSFAAQTVLRFIHNIYPAKQSQQDVEEILSKICCIQAHDIYTLLSSLDDFSHSLKSQTQGSNSKVKLVVVDSVAAVFSPILGGQQRDYLALIEQLGRQLKSIALDFSVAVLVTNNLRSAADGERCPTLGRVWGHVPHTRILLEKDCAVTPPSTLRKAAIVKSVRKSAATVQIDLAS